MSEATSPVAIVTGGSRGIGAAVAQMLAERGADVAINYRSKAARAEEVAGGVRAAGHRCLAMQADLTEAAEVAEFARRVVDELGPVNYLILNAAGGLERDKADDYAYKLNVTANELLLDNLLPTMPAGASVVFVTSHPSHFYGKLPVMAGYERVASTKKAAEDMLRQRIPELAEKNVRLAIVSGDLIEGTINAKLMDRAYPGMMQQRAQDVGALPTVEEFAAAIVDAAMNSELSTGETILVGSADWGTYQTIYSAESDSNN